MLVNLTSNTHYPDPPRLCQGSQTRAKYKELKIKAKIITKKSGLGGSTVNQNVEFLGVDGPARVPCTVNS